MFFIGLGTAVPARRYAQRECWLAFQQCPQFAQLTPRSQAILQKVLRGDNGIRTRHLAVDPLAEAFVLTPEVLDARFARHAPALAAQAAENALRDAGVRAEQIDAVIISTCTGYLCPGLTSYVSELLGLRPDVLAFDLVGQGCGAAVPNLRLAEALLTAARAKRVLSICVEVCSAALYLDNDPGVLISSCLFGDGAGAAVLAPRPVAGSRRVEWKTAETILSAPDRDLLRFERKSGMLRNLLSPQVPALAARHAAGVLQSVLDKKQLQVSQISTWILHAGGREVLAALRKKIGLTETDVARSAAVLSEFGNVSSPFVYFVMQAALAQGAPGGWWWLSSFGAGFSCHGALLRVR